MQRAKNASRWFIYVVLLILFSLSMLSGCGRTGSSFNPSDGESEFEEAIKQSDSGTEKKTITSGIALKQRKLKQFQRANADTSVIENEDIKNILIVGQDRRASQKEEMRSDSIMIFSINTITNEINLISLMRDMYLPCADGKEGMINLTYLNGGAAMLSQTIEMNFGIHIDHFIETDFWRFMDLYEQIGPVDVDLTEEEAPYLNDMTKNSFVPHYDRGDTKPVWNLHSGINAMDPEQLLCFCRARQNLGGDWARTERQRRTIISTYNKLNSMSHAELIRMIQENGHYLNTDMDIHDMLGFFYWLKKNDIIQINSYRIPLDGTDTQEIREGVLNVLIPQMEPNRQALQQYIYGY